MCMSRKQMNGKYLKAFAALHDDDTGVSETARFIVIAGQSAILLPMVLVVDRVRQLSFFGFMDRQQASQNPITLFQTGKRKSSPKFEKISGRKF
jgi:hypothetical protein